MLNEAGLKAAVRAAQETVFGNGVPVWEDDFPPIRAALTAYLASVQGEQKPVAWRHTLHMDGAETAIRLARAEVDRPWGRPGLTTINHFRCPLSRSSPTPQTVTAWRLTGG